MLNKIVFKKLKKDYKKTLLTIFIFALVVFFNLFVFSLYSNIENFFVSQNLWKSSKTKFEISLKENNSFFLDKKETKHKYQKEIKELRQDENIEKIYYLYNTDIPTSISINFFDQEFKTDIFLFWISDNFFSWKQNKDFIPIGISTKLLNFYNLQLANWNFFPKLSEEILYKIFIEISFWESSIFKIKKKSISKKWKVYKVSSLLPTIGITVPYSIAKDVFDKLWKWSLNLYKVIWFVKDSYYVQKIKKKFPELKINTDKEQLREIESRISSVKYLTWTLNIITIFILICFLVYIVYILLDSNKKIFQILRMHWASKKNILYIVLAEIWFYFIIGLLIGILFYFVSYFFIQDYIQGQNLFNYDVSILSVQKIFQILFSFFVIITILTLLISKKEWRKDFED